MENKYGEFVRYKAGKRVVEHRQFTRKFAKKQVRNIAVAKSQVEAASSEDKVESADKPVKSELITLRRTSKSLVARHFGRSALGK